MSLEREARLEDAHATYKASVKEQDLIVQALERKRSRVLEDIDAVEAQIRCMPTWLDSGDEMAALVATRARLWTFVRLLDAQIASTLRAHDAVRRAYCKALDR